VIEHVRDGCTVRAFVLPSYHYITVMLSGIKVSTRSICIASGHILSLSLPLVSTWSHWEDLTVLEIFQLLECSSNVMITLINISLHQVDD